jgi:hypothetical protein
MSMMSNAAVNNVNVVNSVRRQCSQPCQHRQCRQKTWPPSGGVAKATHEITFTLIPNSDFGEITDTASACGGREGFGRH